MSLHFDVTGDNSNFLRKLDEARNGIRSTSKQIEESGTSIEQMFGRMAKGAAALGVGFSAQKFASQVVKVRGEFQQLEVAFNTMLGSEEKANTLMQQLVKTAATTPFDLQGVANGAKQLLAYGTSAEDVNGTLIRLGDIAAGLSIPLGDLVYLYGTTMSQGRLYTQDLNQFAGRGIPMIGELAKQFGVAESEVKKLVESGKVGFPEVQKVIESLTNEGGKFGGLMEAQSKTITGQISNIEDSISTMYNNIGKQSEGLINDALSGVSYLVENYEDIGRIILELVGTYGAYRVALMVTTALQALHASGITALTVKEAVHYGWLVLTKKAQDALNLSMLKNPYVLAAVAVAGLAYGIYKLATAETDVEAAIRTTNESIEAQEKHYDDLKSKSSELSNVLTNESKSIEERFIAYRQLQRLMPGVFKDMDFETAKRLSNTDAIKLETAEILRQQRIGLKTKVVMSEQKIQGLENSIIRTNNSGGYTGALKEDLDAAKKELEIYQKALRDFEDAKKESEKSKNKPIVQNKSFWETEKKKAEEELNALTDIEAAGAKGLALKKRIAGYDKKIGSFFANTSKQESAAEKLREQQEKLTEEIKKSIQERKELLIQSEMDIQQQQIDLKEEGAEKELAQIRLNYDRQYQEIAKRERELLEKLQAEERKQWEKDNPNYEKKGLKFTPKTTSLTPEQRVPFDKEYSLAFQKQEKDTQSLLERLLEKYRDFDAQRTAIEKDGNADIAALQAKRTNENAAEIDRAITVAKQKIKEGIQAVTDTEASKTAEDNPFLKNLFGDTSQMAFKDLQNLIEQAKQLQSYLSGNGDSSGITFITPEQLKTIAESPDELDKLKKALDKLLKGEKGNEWDDIFEGFTKGLAKVKSAKGFKEFSEGMQDIGDSASKASSMIGGVAGNLSSMFEEMGNTGAADAMSGVQDAMNAISNIGQGFAKGGIVGGIAAAVGEAANFIGKAFAANARHKAALKEIMNETIAQQREYNLLLMQQNLEYEKAATIFGTDVYGKAANAVRVMKDAVADLNEELKGSGTYSKGYSFSIKNGVVDDLTKAQRDLYNAYEGLANIEIKTGHKKTGLFGWGKGKDIYSSILSVYPELIKANGEFDASLAETILNTREMSDESKKSLQNMIDLANQAKEAYEAINDYFTDIFGELGNTMSDALVDAFRNGTDAAQAFTDSVSNMLETLAKQMIYSVTLAPIMEKAQKEMMDVMQNVGLSDEQKFSKWTGILDGLVDDAVNQQGLANRLLEEYQQTAKDKGYEIFSPDKSTSQNSTQKGFETMSQDTGTELNGRFTALQVSSEEIKNSMLSMLSGVNLISTSTTANGITLTEIKNLAMSSNNYLEDIAGFQKKIVNDFGRKLDSIDGGIKQFNGKH